jgi:eukaryotic-like serine/threonine-protein kinase
MADPAATPTATPVLFGRYRVQERLGETRLAAIYAATDERLQRRVLLALLRKDLVGQERPTQRFQAEISAGARRSHPALLEVFDSGDVSGRPFMIAEYATGRSLRSLGMLTVEQALLYVRQVAGAVAACQALRSPETPAGLYHPPISSSNVILVDEGRVKLVESWHLPPGDALFDHAHYRAPELSEGAAATPAAAVYALGVLLYELITGMRPITGADARSVALAHLNIRIPAISGVRPTLYLPSMEALVAQATARFPDQRFPNAAAFGAALDALWRELGTETRQLAPVQTPRRGPVQTPRQGVSTDPDNPPPRRSGLTGMSRVLPRERLGPQPIDAQTRRKRSFTRGLMGLALMLSLILIVAGAGYIAAASLAPGLTNVQLPSMPSFPDRPALPGVPTAASDGPFGWLNDLLGRNEIYLVNIADGLNMRSAPDASDDANIVVVVPNGTPVRYLEGPVVSGSITWLRVQTVVRGQAYEGWMSQEYLRRQE